MTQKNKVNGNVCMSVLRPIKMSGDWMETQPFFVSKWVDPSYFISAIQMSVIKNIR